MSFHGLKSLKSRITTVAEPSDERTATRKLIERLWRGDTKPRRRQSFRPELIVRGSSCEGRTVSARTEEKKK